MSPKADAKLPTPTDSTRTTAPLARTVAAAMRAVNLPRWTWQKFYLKTDLSLTEWSRRVRAWCLSTIKIRKLSRSCSVYSNQRWSRQGCTSRISLTNRARWIFGRWTPSKKRTEAVLSFRPLTMEIWISKAAWTWSTFLAETNLNPYSSLLNRKYAKKNAKTASCCARRCTNCGFAIFRSVTTITSFAYSQNRRKNR